METVPAATQDSSSANPSSAKSEDSSPRPEGGRASPPPNCAICLGTCRNKSFTDSCLHQFCFKCLLTWSKVKAECPLCKQNFKSIIHNVRSNHQYEEYLVEQRHTEETTERIDIDSLTTATRRFRYRTTLTLPRRESLAIQQLLVHYPLVADVFPPPAPRAPPALRCRSPASFRRTVYRHNLWARPLPDFTGRYRDCTPEFYRYNDTQMHRLVPWLNRELHYLLNENVAHLSYVLSKILELLPQYHINSNEFREEMHRYLGERTEHFLHELYCFASTPYDITGYDRNVQYTTDTRISTMVNEVISSSDSESVDSDIVMVSHSEPPEAPPGPSRLPAPVYPHNYIPQPRVNNVIPIETIYTYTSDTDDDDSEVMVVGYIKPPQDRTPEVVDLLGSDSDVIVQDSTQPEASQGTSGEAQAPASQLNLVKLSLKRHRTPENESDSEDSLYRPQRRRRRPRSAETATTSDTTRTTPSPAAPAAPTASAAAPTAPTAAHVDDDVWPSSSSTSSSPTTTTSSDTSTSSYNSTNRRKNTKKKSKRKTKNKKIQTSKNKTKSRYRALRRENKKNDALSDAGNNKRSKRKSYSGKGVKSSKRAVESAATSSHQTPVGELEQPGPSGAATKYRQDRDRKRRRSSRESKRLRSVVNVMYSQKTSGGSNCSGNVGIASSSLNQDSSGSVGNEERVVRGEPLPSSGESSVNLSAALKDACAACEDSDSEDNLPLNLTVKKT